MTSFDSFISNFHFIRPFWLLAIFVLIPIIWQLKKLRFYQSPWQQLLPMHLSQVLVESSASPKSKTKSITEQGFLLKPLIIGLLSIIALAGPTWEKLPQPVYQTERGSVLIMDMSYSMFATDIKPNRLTRARFKAIDLLNKINEGDTGLIAYAGDAFVISPLTQDVKNIALLLPSLTPEIMPVPGANPLAALTLAHEMLINAGHLNGDIYWFTDDADNQEITDIYQWSTSYGHQLNILGIGTENGAPITLPSGELLKDNSGAIVVPRLPSQKLKSLASRGNGNYQTIKNDDSDINNLIIHDKINKKNATEKQQSQQTGDQWQEQGAWLLLVVLPLMLSYFRRGGTLLMLPLTCLPLLTLLSLTLVSPTSVAATSNESVDQTAIEPKSAWQKQWNNLWQTNDQQAQIHYNQQNYQDAANQFDNAQWQGSAHYKAGNYEAALEAFKKGEQGNSANALYNQGNALAQLQQYDQAIESYEKALSMDPDLQDAKENLEKIKQLQKQQQQQQQQGDNSQNSNDQKENDPKENDQKDNEEQQDSQSDQSNSDQSKSDQSQQNQDNQNQDNQNQQSSDNDNTEQQQQNSPSNDEQNAEQNDENQQKNSQSNSEEQKAEEAKEQQAQQDKQAAEQPDKTAEQGEEKTAAQIAAEQQAKEAEQKYQQLLNKVTDDPYLLLRNKMQLEYQKRKQNGTSQGVNKQW